MYFVTQFFERKLVTKSKLDETELTTVRSYDPEAEEQFRGEPSPEPWDDLIWAQSLMVPDPFLLDIGCGHGRMIPCLRQLGITRYVGIDPSVEMIRIARREYPEVDVREMNLYELPEYFREETFDAFLALAVLMHVSPEKMPAALATIRAVLKKGAVGITNFTDANQTTRVVHGEVHDQTYRGLAATMNGWVLDRIGPVLEQAGFSLERVHYWAGSYDIYMRAC